MKIFLQKVEYSLLALFLAVQTQVPFVLIQFYKGRDQSFSMGYTLLILMIYLLIIFYALRMAKKEGLLTLDFSFFNLKSVIWLVLSYLITFKLLCKTCFRVRPLFCLLWELFFQRQFWKRLFSVV